LWEKGLVEVPSLGRRVGMSAVTWGWRVDIALAGEERWLPVSPGAAVLPWFPMHVAD